MGFVIIRGQGDGCPTSDPLVRRRHSAETGRRTRREPGRPSPLLSARSRSRPFLVVACLLMIAVFAASCGGDDTSDGDAPDSVETSDDDRTTSDDEADADDDANNETADQGEDETDATTSTVADQKPAPHYESDVFANAYSAARDAYTSYSSARHDGYFVALGNVSSAVEEAGAARAAALAGAAAAFDDIESEARQIRRNVFSEIQGRRDAASAEDKSSLDRVNAILDAAHVEAEIDWTESYFVWENIGYQRGTDYFSSREFVYAIKRIAGKVGQRLSFDETYLAALDQAILDSSSDSAILTAIAAARDAVVVTLENSPLPYESADAAIDAAFAAVEPVQNNRKTATAERLEARIDPLLEYDIVTPSREAAAAALNAIAASADRDSLEQALAEEERVATAAYDEVVAAATSDREAAVAVADRAYERAVEAVADAVADARAAFDFDAWVSAAFALADAYVVLYDVAVAVESEAQVNDDGSLAAASAVEYASAVRRELGAVAATANSLADGYPRRTILDVEPEFARAAEALFLEAEFFEDALEAARSRAEARAKALNG